ncbi:Oligopeptidase A [Escherichia coli IS5]|nr:Oligopeptidase A [Escherichia coli IS5]
MTNPLLTPFELPPFSKILPEHVVPAVTKALNDCRENVERVVAQGAPYTWENLCQPLAEVDDVLGRIFSPISHLNSVKNSPELREAYEQTLPLLSEYSTWVGQHEGLYKAYRDLRDGDHYATLNTAQKKAVDNALRDFELSGIGLPKEKQQRYGEIATRLSELGNQYSNNVLDATMGWTKLVTDEAELAGMPESALAAAKAQAEAKELEGYLLTLDIPSYLPVMTYCDNQALREEMYRAYSTRASDQGPNAGKWDNSKVMEEILALRHELAQLLGFENYAFKSLATKMAENPQQVLDFLTDLAKRARPQGEKELAQLRAFAKAEFGVDELQPWDIAYYSEKQKQHLYSISDEQLRPYFPENKAVNGLFEMVKRIYGITAKERKDVDVWHPDVRFFELYDENNELRGSFYLDLYARENKRGGAWMDDCVGQMRKADGSLQKPVAYLTCNFNRPVNGKPALFTHDEVITLFHEFGHGLHHMLTRIETAGVSGISGVPWDAVELPSQFMENWCWEPEALAFISGHYETGEPLPKELLDKMLAAKNYQAALFILRQLEFGLFDFRLHAEFRPDQGAKILETLAEIKKLVAVVPSPSWGRFPHAFSHIFAGGYAAGYYSYLWADVLAADAFSRFEEEGIFNRETGQSFLDNILSRGGSEEPMDLFKRFRGREPQLDAMLEHYGIKADHSVKICLIDETGTGDGALSVLAARWGLEHDEDNLMALVLTPEHLELRKRDEPKLGGIFVDFVGGAMAHRRKFGGGRGEAVAKAVGIKGDYLPDVVDATAGLGRDAFVLASVGCRVRMLERNPVVAALLDDGLARGYADAEIGGWLQERLQLIHASSLTALTDITPRPQVVYLDPMFPHKQKSALVKKEMRVFQSLVGPDLDADGLLEPARLLATKRVVVKRPDYAPPLANVATPNAVVTKGHRFDIYAGTPV